MSSELSTIVIGWIWVAFAWFCVCVCMCVCMYVCATNVVGTLRYRHWMNLSLFRLILRMSVHMYVHCLVFGSWFRAHTHTHIHSRENACMRTHTQTHTLSLSLARTHTLSLSLSLSSTRNRSCVHRVTYRMNSVQGVQPPDLPPEFQTRVPAFAHLHMYMHVCDKYTYTYIGYQVKNVVQSSVLVPCMCTRMHIRVK